MKYCCSSIVLAGGKSSRMGHDKALIQLHGQPLLTKICLIAQECAENVYVVTSWPDKYREILPPGCQLVLETSPYSQKGPLLAFYQSLKLIHTPWVLLLACDLPKLTALSLQQWSAELDNCPTEAIASLAKTSFAWEPLVGFYRSACVTSLTSYINAGGTSFQGWLSTQPVCEKILKDHDILYNCNTPQELEDLYKN